MSFVDATVHVGEEGTSDYLNAWVRDGFQLLQDVQRHTMNTIVWGWSGAMETQISIPNEDVANVAGFTAAKWHYWIGGADQGAAVGAMYTTIDEGFGADGNFIQFTPGCYGATYYFRMNSGGFPDGRNIIQQRFHIVTASYQNGSVGIGMRRHSDSVTHDLGTVKWKAGVEDNVLVFPKINPFTGVEWTEADIRAFDASFEFYIIDSTFSSAVANVELVRWEIDCTPTTGITIPGDPWPVSFASTETETFIPLGGLYLGQPWFHCVFDKNQQDTYLRVRATWHMSMDTSGIIIPALACNDVIHEGSRIAFNDGGNTRCFTQVWDLYSSKPSGPFPGVTLPPGTYRIDLMVKLTEDLVSTLRTPQGFFQMEVIEVAAPDPGPFAPVPFEDIYHMTDGEDRYILTDGDDLYH